MATTLGTSYYSAQFILGSSAVLVCAIVLFFRFLSPQWRSSLSSRAPTAPKISNADSKGGQEAYVNVFPPSQRENLALISQKLPKLPKAGQVLDLEADYRTANADRMVFSGFTAAEVRALGHFPDYATLSGVPLPAPLKNFNIDTALPRPYRPFRWAYHQTMSLKKMEPDYWIELENTYRHRLQQRRDLYNAHGKDVLQSLPGSELACKELMEMVLQFICARYPEHFEVQGTTFINRILGTKQDTLKENPLKVLLDNVPEDFGIMLRDPTTGHYVLRAGVICSSVGWCLGDKMGHGLPAIHKTVPDYKEKMEFSMDRFFTKMPTFKPIQRGSWGLEVGEPLHLPSTHPDLQLRNHQDPNLTEADINLRVDWQTLRRLPLSGAVVFSFKALFTPMTEFKDEPYIPTLVLKILNEGKENIMKYKGTWHVEHVVKPKLREYEEYQIKNGLMKKDWEPQTLDENPFFIGWEEKWQKQQQKA